jgi:hypothetical protein
LLLDTAPCQAMDQPPTVFQSRVYDVVRTIPKGKVRTYGSIAKGEERRFHFVRKKKITIMPCSFSTLSFTSIRTQDFGPCSWDCNGSKPLRIN